MNAPKAPLTGYVRFLNDGREQVRADNANASFSDITKILAQKWGAMPADEKNVSLSVIVIFNCSNYYFMGISFVCRNI